MDDIDTRILNCLQPHGRQKNNELTRQLDIVQSTVFDIIFSEIKIDGGLRIKASFIWKKGWELDPRPAQLSDFFIIPAD